MWRPVGRKRSILVKVNQIYMDAVVSRFGLKAENSLWVGLNGLPGGPVLVLGF